MQAPILPLLSTSYPIVVFSDQSFYTKLMLEANVIKFSMHLSSPCDPIINIRMSKVFSNFSTIGFGLRVFLIISVNDGRLPTLFLPQFHYKKTKHLINMVMCMSKKKETNFNLLKNSQLNKHVQITKMILFLFSRLVLSNCRYRTRGIFPDQ